MEELTHEVGKLREQLEEAQSEPKGVQSELEGYRDTVEEMESRVERQLQEQEGVQAVAKLPTLRAVAAENKKWESVKWD